MATTPRAETEVVHFRLPTVVINELRRLAEEGDRPLARELVRAVKFWVAQNDAQEKQAA